MDGEGIRVLLVEDNPGDARLVRETLSGADAARIELTHVERLSDALKRLIGLADQIGIHAVTVHALDDNARSFYRAVGFLPLKDDAYHLYLPMATVRQL